MSIFSAFKSAFASGAKELNREYGKSNDFLNGVAASCALVAYADGTLEDSERKKAMDVLTNHTQLSTIYTRPQIEQALSAALGHATTASGKQELSRALDKVLSAPDGHQMAEDVYLVAFDVAGSNSHGKPGEDETNVLGKIATRLGVDVSKFDFT